MPDSRCFPRSLLRCLLIACVLASLAASGCGGKDEDPVSEPPDVSHAHDGQAPDDHTQDGHAHDGSGGHSHADGDDPAPEDVPIVRHEPGSDAGPHGGVVARLSTADEPDFGWIEAKLHDDKGDIELWLARDRAFEQPLDLPLKATVGILFPERDDRRVVLRVRNAKRNEDEDGTANVRKGRTNYFIFPGDTGADASWLKGAAFRELARVELRAEAQTLVSDDFELQPHLHGAGSGHAHDEK